MCYIYVVKQDSDIPHRSFQRANHAVVAEERFDEIYKIAITEKYCDALNLTIKQK